MSKFTFFREILASFFLQTLTLRSGFPRPPFLMRKYSFSSSLCFFVHPVPLGQLNWFVHWSEYFCLFSFLRTFTLLHSIICDTVDTVLLSSQLLTFLRVDTGLLHFKWFYTRTFDHLLKEVYVVEQCWRSHIYRSLGVYPGKNPDKVLGYSWLSEVYVVEQAIFIGL